jgi:hypothetical protein
MRTLFLTLTSAILLVLGACSNDTGSGGISADTGPGDDNQISGTDAISNDVATTCVVGSDTCGAGHFCSAPVGQCTGSGTCAARPQICTLEYGPICGCDGKDYGNGCQANSAGVVMNKGGSCTPTRWYTTCGMPVCGTSPKPDPNVPACTTQKDGDACTTGAPACDLLNDCGQHLVCADKDPKTNPGGCPISRRAKKTDIRYLNADDVKKLQGELLKTKLATYKYKDAGPQAPQQLGFIIDDQPDSPAVDARRDMVDLYGYLSMSVAAIQVQQKQLAEQARRIEQLEKKLSAAPACK